MLAPQFFALFLLPASVFAHECPAFVLNSEEKRDEVLGIDTDFFPQAIKDIIEDDPEEMFTGNYDCHNVAGDFEVGVAFICDEDEECSCTALYQFEECRSCEICGEVGDVNGFTADCSNVEGFTNECVVECGYVTEGCFDPAEMIITNTTDTETEPEAPETEPEEPATEPEEPETEPEETPAVTDTEPPVEVSPTSTSSASDVALGAVAAMVAVALFA